VALATLPMLAVCLPHRPWGAHLSPPSMKHSVFRCMQAQADVQNGTAASAAAATASAAASAPGLEPCHLVTQLAACSFRAPPLPPAGATGIGAHLVARDCCRAQTSHMQPAGWLPPCQGPQQSPPSKKDCTSIEVQAEASRMAGTAARGGRRSASLPACPSTQLACHPISSTSSHLREPQARLPQEVQAECSWLHRRGRRWGSGHTPWHATAAANVPVASPPARWVPAPRPWAVRSPPPEPKVQQRQHLEVQAGIHNGWHHSQSRRCPRHRCSRRRGPGGVPSCSQPANQYTPSAIELARPTQPLLPSLAAS
jgi:hypothetical protein